MKSAFFQSTRKVFVALILLSFTGTQLWAQPDDSVEMDDLDLNELFTLDLEVTVASKKSEKISDAPGMVTAYSDADMKNLGYYTIRDLADLTAGFSSYRSIGEITLQTRGQKTAGFDNNRHLLLVDGIPVRHSRANKVPVEEELSLYGAKRVEFMKGPGSALYGTGAFNGVISVVSKDRQENGVEAEGRISIGTDNITKNVMGTIVAKNDNGQVRATASYFDKESSGEYVRVRSGNEVVSDSLVGYRNWNDRNAISLNMNYTHKSGVEAGFIYSRKNGGLGEFWWGKSSKFNNIVWETSIPYMKFSKKLSDIVSLNSYGLANISSEQDLFTGSDTEEGGKISGTAINDHKIFISW